MPRILIVEDSPTQAEVLRMTLEGAGYEVTVTANVDAAMTELGTERCDLIISDIMMPGKSGYEFCTRLKGDPEYAAIPVIFVTSLSDPMDIIMGLEAGAENFIPKPYEPSYLINRVKTVLHNNETRGTGKFAVGVDVNFLGRNFTITADRQQIIDLLIQTFEETIRTNRALRASRAELAAAKAQVEEHARHLEGQVETSEAKYQVMMENASDAFFILDLDGLVRETNRSATKMLGRADAELVGTGFASLLAVSGSALTGGSGSTREAQLIKADGTLCWAELSMSTVAVGTTKMILVIARDISRRKAAELQLAREQETLRAIASSIADALITIDGNGIIDSANRAAEQMFGWTVAELIGRNVNILVPEPDHSRHDDYLRNYQKTRVGKFIGIGPREVTARHRDGHPIPVELALAEMAIGGECRFVGVVRDATKRKQAEAAQRDLQARLHQAQKMEAIGNLTGGLAHDFNNLLAIVIGNLDLLADSLGSYDPSLTQLVADATAAGLRGADLTRHLLAFSRQQPLEPKRFDVNERLGGMMKLLSRLLGEDIESKFIPAMGVWEVKADPVQLESALANLAVNARDAMPTGGRFIVETGNTHLDQDYTVANPEVVPGDYVVIEVSDTGTGIPPEILPHVFEPFFTTKAVGKGSGLGLSMVYGFIKQSGGNLKIYSEVGRGTTIRIYLPRDRAASDHSDQEENELPVGAPEARTILVVDDNIDVRKMVVTQLRRFGHCVHQAADGTQALDVLAEVADIELLFTDLVMPGGMNGLELAITARQRRPGLKVLFTSGFPLSMMNGGLLGRDDVLLSKPYRPNELQRKIHEAFLK